MFVRQRHPRTKKHALRRSGAVLVENAVVASVFGLFMAGIMEFGSAYMVQGAMNAAAQRAARYGSVEGVTNAEVEALARKVINSAFRSARATVTIKNAAVFDEQSVNPSNIDYANLPNIQLADAETNQLFLVRITVPYNSVALLPPFWIKNVTLKSQSVMRHE